MMRSAMEATTLEGGRKGGEMDGRRIALIIVPLMVRLRWKKK